MWKQSLRVCHLSKFYPPARGGIERHVQALARGQAALGAEVSVICVNHLDEQARDVAWRGLKSTPTVADADGAVRVTRLGRRLSICRVDWCRDIVEVLRAAEPVDIVHLHMPNPTMLWGISRVRIGRTLVITHHSDIVRRPILRTIYRPFEYAAYSRAARVLATSPAYQAGSPTLLKYSAKVETLALGIDLEPYVRPGVIAMGHCKRLRAGCRGPRWLVVGRCVYYKGTETAVRALVNAQGTLMIVGDGPLERDLRQLAERLGVADRVHWLGSARDEELIGAYHAATALWFPSNARSEAFGLVQVEAMASGCPVINTAIPDSGVAWVSRDGETGLTVAVNDAPALARAATRLLTEDGLRERLAAGAQHRARAEFDDQTMAKRSLQIYQWALEERMEYRQREPVLEARPSVFEEQESCPSNWMA